MNVHHYRRSHVQDAFLEMRGAQKEIAKDAPKPKLTHRYSPRIGDAYGDLTIVAQAESKHGRVWQCRCLCGAHCVRNTGQLNQAARLGSISACADCRRTKRARQRETWRDLQHEAFRKQYVDRQTLWTQSQSDRLRDQILEDLESEFGELDESIPSSFAVAAGFPFGACDHTRRQEAIEIPRCVVRTGDEPRWTQAEIEPLGIQLTDRVLDQIGRVQATRAKLPRVRHFDPIPIRRKKKKKQPEQPWFASIPTRSEHRRMRESEPRP